MLKRNFIGSWIAVCGILLSTGWAQADQKVPYTPAKKECFKGTSVGRNWKYCVYTAANGKTNPRVAYMLHGRNLNEHVWNDDTYYTAMIQRYWQEHNIVPPTVVTVSFGPVWLLAPLGKMPASGLLDLLAQAVMPEIERNIGIPQQRILFGESMGGINSLMLGLKHSSLFHKVAALCPPVYLGTPFDSEDVLEKFYQRTGANRETMADVIRLAKVFYADVEEWNQTAPLSLIKKMQPSMMPQLYLSCGLYDMYGNFEGADALAQLAQSKQKTTIWRPLYGPHCAIDIPSLAEFLTN